MLFDVAVMYYDNDAHLEELSGLTVAVIGYGSQGHAHAQNLRDSGVNVIVANRPGSANYQAAVADGFQPVSAAEAAAQADVIVMLTPDHAQPQIYCEDVAPHLTAGKALVFSHGFNMHFKQIVPPDNVD
ncbi:MAG: NAD(P)-dependent oxidoreductase, partial [Limnochordales bacterium]